MKKSMLMLMALLLILLLSACAGQEKKSDEPTVGTVSSEDQVANANRELANYPLVGFGNNQTNVNPERWDDWAKNAAPAVTAIINNMPEGYVFRVSGHANASGPEEPTGRLPGNIKLSEGRAKEINDALRRQGVNSKRMRYTGAGSSKPSSQFAPEAPEQRRVTFDIVPQ